MRADEREVLERTIQRVTEQAAAADAIVDEALWNAFLDIDPDLARDRREKRQAALETFAVNR